MVSNGNITAEALAYLRPHLVGYKIDLKTMNDHNYRELGTKLQNILDGIKMVHESGLWVEIVTLVVPGFNNSDAELKEAAKFIASVSPDIPWHVTAFHQDYKFLATETTKAHMLLRACEIGKEAGLNYVYAGNLPGMTGDWENTYCPNCRSILVERIGFHVQKILLSVDGNCHSCGTKIPGIWA
jgi:pyruvate formate lyase activating enzyme